MLVLVLHKIYTIPSTGILLTELMSTQTLYMSVIARVFGFTHCFIYTIDMMHLYIFGFIPGFCSKQERFLYTWRFYARLIYSNLLLDLFCSDLSWTLPILQILSCLTVFSEYCLSFRPCPIRQYIYWTMPFFKALF